MRTIESRRQLELQLISRLRFDKLSLTVKRQDGDHNSNEFHEMWMDDLG